MSFMVFAFLSALSVTYSASASRESLESRQGNAPEEETTETQSFESMSPHATGLIATSASAAWGVRSCPVMDPYPDGISCRSCGRSSRGVAGSAHEDRRVVAEVGSRDPGVVDCEQRRRCADHRIGADRRSGRRRDV